MEMPYIPDDTGYDQEIRIKSRKGEVERQLEITEILAGIEKAWRAQSFLRFGQMMQNCFGCKDIFHLSNHKLVQQLTGFTDRSEEKL